MTFTFWEFVGGQIVVALVAWVCGRQAQWAQLWKQRESLCRLERASSRILDLMDEVPVDPELGERWEFQDLRAALEYSQDGN